MEDKSIPSQRIPLPPPPVLLLVSIFSELALHWWLPVANLWGRSGRGLGYGVLVASLSIFISSAMLFRRRQTTIIPFRESAALLTDGLYRFSRNPIYLSMVMLLCGIAITLGSAAPWGVPPLFMAIISRQFIQKEEAMLADTFGEEYLEYCRRVRRWF